MRAREFLKRDIEDTLKNELPILSGKLEDAPLQTRTVLRDKYKIWCPQITFRTTGEVVTAKNLDLEKIRPDKLQELGNPLNPEILLDKKQSKEKEDKFFDGLKKSDPTLYWTLMKNRTETRVNKSKAAKDLKISRQALDKRLKKIRKKSQS